MGFNYSILQKTVNILILQNEKRSISESKKEIIYLGAAHDFGLFDFNRYDEMIAFGYEEAKKLIDPLISKA